MTTEQENAAQPSGIAGWLLLPAFALIIQPIMAFKYIVLDAARMRSRGFQVHHNWLVVLVDLAIVLLAFLVASTFFKRCAIAPPMFVSYVMLVFVMTMIVEAFQAARDAPIIADLFAVLFFPAYFAFSRRVKKTFVQPSSRGFLGPGIIRRLEPAMLGFRDFLALRRRWIIVYAIAFIAAVLTLQGMIRAWRIDGNVLKFLQYY